MSPVSAISGDPIDQPVLFERVAVDHLVIAAPTLDLASEYVADTLGIRPKGGGAHPGRGTHNALLGLGRGAYLEAIGADPEQPDPERPRAFGIDRLQEPKLVTWALRAGSLDSLTAGLQHARFGRSQEMSRRLEGGELLQWRLAFPRFDDPETAQPEPFLIDWAPGVSPGFNLEPAGTLRAVAFHGRHPGAEEVVARSDRHDDGLSVTFDGTQRDCLRLTAEIETGRGVVALSS